MPKYDRRYLAERQLFNHTKHFTAMMCWTYLRTPDSAYDIYWSSPEARMTLILSAQARVWHLCEVAFNLATAVISWLELSINMDSFGYAKGTKELKSLRIVRLVRSLRIVRLVMDAPATITSVFFIRSEWLIIIFRMIQIILILWQRCSSLEPGSSSYLHSKPRV